MRRSAFRRPTLAGIELTYCELMSFHLHQLHAFTTIVSSGSLGRAAALLNVTQPALSRTIKRLEEDVGASLFERHVKGMQLTDIGAALLPHAQLLLREAENAREEIDAMRGLAKGTIKVGAVGSLAAHFLPLAVDRVLGKWGNLHVEIIEGVWDRLAEGLINYEIDLALSTATNDSDEIVAVPDCRWEDNSFVVAAFSHPLRKKPKLTLADTLTARWAIPPKGTAPYEHMRETFLSRNLDMPDIAVRTRSVTVLKSLVVECSFLSWMPEPMYDSESKAGIMGTLPIPGISAARTLTAFQRRNGILPRPAARLLEELRSLTERGMALQTTR